jgi:hypothetical protein
MTITMLLANTIRAAELASQERMPEQGGDAPLPIRQV